VAPGKSGIIRAGLFLRLGLFDFSVGQRHLARPPASEKCPHLKTKMPKKVPPPKHGCTWTRLDAEDVRPSFCKALRLSVGCLGMFLEGFLAGDGDSNTQLR